MKVGWDKLIWFSYHIPKHPVISWMAILNRLPTKDRLLSWGIEVDGRCLFCQSELETRDHLFFGCRYSKSIWEAVLQLCQLNRRTASWNEELHWGISRLKGKALISVALPGMHIYIYIYIYIYVYTSFGRREITGISIILKLLHRR